MGNIRTFIAVDIPKEIKMELDRLISELRPLGPDIRWVKAANLHLTMRFLGDIPKSSIQGLSDCLPQSLKDFGAFEISLAQLGGFPSLRKARVIWVGGGEGADKLVSLALAIENACLSGGFGPADKPFSPHLTIGRVKFPKVHEKLIETIEGLNFRSPLFAVNEVVIFKSDLSPSGPKYTSLDIIGL